MVKHVPDIIPSVLTFYVEKELEKQDVEWMLRLIETTYKRHNRKVLLYVEFGDFGVLTFKRTFKHWGMIHSNAGFIINRVDKIVATSDAVILRSRLLFEFNLLPSVSLRAYAKHRKHRGVAWLKKSVESSSQVEESQKKEQFDSLIKSKTSISN